MCAAVRWPRTDVPVRPGGSRYGRGAWIISGSIDHLGPQGTERVVGATDRAGLAAFVKARLGSVKTPKQSDVWPDLPRSKVGKVLKNEITQRFRRA